MVLGLRTLGKGLRAGAGVAAGTAKAVAWVAVGTVVNVGRVVLAAKAAVTGEHREESPCWGRRSWWLLPILTLS